MTTFIYIVAGVIAVCSIESLLEGHEDGVVSFLMVITALIALVSLVRVII